MYTDDIFITADIPTFVYWNGNTRNTPFKAGLTECQEGFAFRYGTWADYMTVVCFVKNDSTMWIWSKGRNAWVEYAAKSDLKGLGATINIREENGGVLATIGSKDNLYGLYISVDPSGVTVNYKTNSQWATPIHLAAKS